MMIVKKFWKAVLTTVLPPATWIYLFSTFFKQNNSNACLDVTGYTSADGCIEDFENSSDYSRNFQADQKCICDTEHMFNCPANGAGGDSAGQQNQRKTTDTVKKLIPQAPLRFRWMHLPRYSTKSELVIFWRQFIFGENNLQLLYDYFVDKYFKLKTILSYKNSVPVPKIVASGWCMCSPLFFISPRPNQQTLIKEILHSSLFRNLAAVLVQALFLTGFWTTPTNGFGGFLSLG